MRAQVLEVLDALVENYGLTLVFVSHDLHVVRQICDEVIVMHDGRIIEAGPIETIWEAPAAAYTARLLAAAQVRSEASAAGEVSGKAGAAEG